MIFTYQLNKEWLSILFLIIIELIIIYYHQYYLAFIPILLLSMRWKLNYTYEILDDNLTIGTYIKNISVSIGSLDCLVVYDNKILSFLGFKYGLIINGVGYNLFNNLFNDEGRRLVDVLVNDYGLPLKKGKHTSGLVKIK